MTRHRQVLGELGEDLAARELIARGYAILDRRYRTKHGEIDIVAEHSAAFFQLATVPHQHVPEVVSLVEA